MVLAAQTKPGSGPRENLTMLVKKRGVSAQCAEFVRVSYLAL
jgi:hypothetical protein